VRGGFGPRFVVEAIFLVAVAVVAGFAAFPWEAIVLVMALAWLLVAGVEWALSRSGAFPGQTLLRRSPPQEAPLVAAPEAPTAQHVRVIPREPEPTAQPVIERRPEPMPEPELEAPPAPEPTPPVEPARAEPTPAAEQPAVEPALPEPEPEPEAEPARAPSGGLAPAGTVPGTEREVPEPEAEPELEPATVPGGGLAPAGTVRGPDDGAPSPPVEDAEPEPEPEPERPPLVAVERPPVPVPAEPEPEPAAAPDEGVVALPLPGGPREWNVWELERLVREHGGVDVAVDEERSYLLVYLREFATPEGTLPLDFDELVRESFGPLLAARR
jgi:hypothetical protein